MSRQDNPGTRWYPSLPLMVKNWLRSKEGAPLNKHLRVGAKSGSIYFICVPISSDREGDGLQIGWVEDSVAKVGIKQWDGEGFPIFPNMVVFKAEDPEFFPKLRRQLILWHNKLIHPASCPPILD